MSETRYTACPVPPGDDLSRPCIDYWRQGGYYGDDTLWHVHSTVMFDSNEEMYEFIEKNKDRMTRL